MKETYSGTLRTICILALFALATACGDEASSDATTSCGNETCQAGAYCADPVFSDCRVGCISNTNCASGETCHREQGESVGSCVAQQIPSIDTDTDDLEADSAAFCARVSGCQVPLPLTCGEIFAATNTACHQCVAGANCGDIFDAGSCDAACGFADPGFAWGDDSGDVCIAITANDTACTWNSDCGAGNHCHDGECYDGSRGAPCHFDNECDSVCTNNCCQ